MRLLQELRESKIGIIIDPDNPEGLIVGSANQEQLDLIRANKSALLEALRLEQNPKGKPGRKNYGRVPTSLRMTTFERERVKEFLKAMRASQGQK